MKTKIIQNTKSIILALILVTGVSIVSAWAGPSLPPPGGNVPAPINVGGGGAVGTPAEYSQTKSGILNLAHLFTSDLNVTNADGSVTGIPAGSVLMADGDNTGKVKWGAGLAGFSCPSGKLVTGFNLTGTPVCGGVSQTVRFDKPGTYSWTIPAGVTEVSAEVWAGGGGGGGNDNGLGRDNGGSGGGSGSYSSKKMTVTPGSKYTVIVGAGGAQRNDPGGRDCGPYGGTGGTSSVALSTTPTSYLLKTNGGTGGRLCYSTPGGTGGLAGIGDIVFAGKNGGAGKTGATMGDGGVAYDGSDYGTFILNTQSICPIDNNGTHSYYGQVPGTGGSGGGIKTSDGVSTGGRKWACPGTDGLVIVSY